MTVSELHLVSGEASIVIDARNGGRLASLEVRDLQLLVVEAALGTLQWGSYPMVPWAGRIREGSFRFREIAYQLPCNLPPHSAHGVGFTSPWSIVDERTITLDLDHPWPFGGRVTQRFDLSDDDLLITMIIEAAQDMPVMAGWHPWFSRYLDAADGPVEASLEFGEPQMYELDDAAIPTGELVATPPGPWDNCFASLDRNPKISWPGLLDLELSSSCDHWVVYSEPEHALCVEPQSDAPDVFNRSPTILKAGQQQTSWFRLRWG